MRNDLLALATMILVILVLAADVAEAKGPWRGRTVDAETSQPISGVVVVASWTERTPGWPHPNEALFEVAEVVSGSDGSFTIPERSLKPHSRSGAVVGPEIRMFKAGYGLWRFQGSGPYPLLEDVVVRLQRAERELAKLEHEDMIFELPPVKTRKERLAVLETLGIGFDPELVPRWVEAYSRERVFLGLTPYPDKP